MIKPRKLAGYLMPAFLVLIVFFLVAKNYSSGRWLLGWDSLHPEFNFLESLQRVFSGVWREEQGLGAVNAHADITEIARLLFVGIISLFLGQENVRWIYTFLCLALGPLGVYFFLSYVFRREKEGTGVYLSSFLGALFYLLNLGTLQHFFVPLEMFPIQFAGLPWLFLFVLKFIREGTKNNFILLFLVSLLATPMAYAPALFYTYFAALTIFLFGYWALSKFSRQSIKRAFVVVFLVLAANAFWLLPSLYSAKNQSADISQAKTNTLFSPEAFLRNVDFGSAKDVLIQRNFLFDWRVFDFNRGDFVDLLGIWKMHLENENILRLGYALSGLSILGAIFSIFRRNKIGIGLLAISAFSLFFLLNINYSTGVLYKYLYDNFGMFKEGFRMPFTKVSILFEFCLSFFFGYFFFRIFSRRFLYPLAIVASFGIIAFMMPAFKGNLISEVVKSDFPQEYSDLFNWFKEKDGRIAKLPLHSQWGWEYRDWGYEGSGFLTYGLSNPLLDRDFDRWSPYNEGFFNEASSALYSGDSEAFLKTLQKYQVKYLLLDESIINAGGTPEILFVPEIKSILSVLNIRETAKFGFLTVYETDFGGEFVSTPAGFLRFDTDSKYSETDTVFTTYGNYVNDSEGITFPFVNLDKRMGVMVEDIGGRLLIKSRELNFTGAKDIVAPDITFGEKEESLRVSVNEESKVQVSLPIDQKTSANLESPEQDAVFQNCDLKKLGQVKREIRDGKIVHQAQNGGVACEFFSFPDISYSQGHLLHIKGANNEGRSLKVYLQNWKTGRMDLEELLPSGEFDEYFFILPHEEAGGGELASGYSLNLETRSFGRVSAENTIETIEFVPVPISWLREIRLVPANNPEIATNNLKINNVKKTGTWLYRVQTSGSGLLEIGQGYEEGWIAFSGSDFKNKFNHVKINSWANGWEIKGENNEITILFWPQLLEYLGFGILGTTFLWILKTKKKSPIV